MLNDAVYLLRSIKALPPFVFAIATRARNNDVLRHTRRFESERARDCYDGALALFGVTSTKVGENRASVYDFQTKAPVRNQDASDVRQNGVVILLGFKESEGVQQDCCLEMPPTKRQCPHITANPISLNPEFGTNVMCLGQQCDSEIHPYYRRAKLRQCECMSSVPASNI